MWETKISWKLIVWMLILLSMSILGFYAWYVIRMIPGNENINQFVPWGILPPLYIFLVTSGTCLVLSLGEVFEIEKFKAIVRRALWLSVATLLIGLFVIILDLGRPERFYYTFIGCANLSSPMFWMIYLYVAETIFLLIEFWFIFRRDFALIANKSSGLKRFFYRLLSLGTTDASVESMRRDLKIARGVGFMTLVLALAAYSNLGNIFAVLANRSFWYGSLIPVKIVITAFVLGSALTILASVTVYWARKKEMSFELKKSLLELRKLVVLSIVVYLFFISWEYTSKAWSTSPDIYESVLTVFTGPIAFEFWVFEIIFGLITPFLILAIPKLGKTLPGLFTAALLITIGIFSCRYDMVVGGLIPPVLPGTPHGAYVPSAMESLFTIGVFSLVTLIVVIGELIIPLDEPLPVE